MISYALTTVFGNVTRWNVHTYAMRNKLDSHHNNIIITLVKTDYMYNANTDRNMFHHRYQFTLV